MNSKHKAPIAKTVSSWLTDAAKQLDAQRGGTNSARLDAELILSHTLRQNRTWLHAHGEEAISPHNLQIADARLQLRLDYVPIAYIIGHKEFYGRRFLTTPAALIPRPESEDSITLIKALPTHTPTPHLLDVGTGTGCLGITLKLECPSYDITLSDISNKALNLARQNAKQLHATVNTIESDLLKNVTGVFDVIVANLPYVDRTWEVSPETSYEPPTALYADNGGMDYILRLLTEALDHILPKGYLVLEADPCQHAYIIECAEKCGYIRHTVEGYIVVLQRI